MFGLDFFFCIYSINSTEEYFSALRYFYNTYPILKLTPFGTKIYSNLKNKIGKIWMLYIFVTKMMDL